jgi:putative hemolysin
MEIYVALLMVLLVLSAFFSSAETAFVSLPRMQLEHAVREGEPGASRVAALLSAPARLLAAILLGNNLVNTAAAAVATLIATDLVGGGAGVALATATVTILLVIFGEVAPKTVALQYSYPVSVAYSLPLRPWVLLTRPLVVVLDLAGQALVRVLGGQAGDRRGLSLGELRTSILVGRELGTLREKQSAMLLGALGLQQTPVRQLMVPRVDMVAIEGEAPIQAAAERLTEAGYSRLPVYGESVDDVLGIAHLSDMTRALLRGEGAARVAGIVRPAVFEPETATGAAVLERMQSSSNQMAILIDEHGSTAGLVTMEDLLEEIVGEIQSESGAESWPVETGARARLVVPGRLHLGDLSEQLGVDLTLPGVETVAGVLLEKLQRIPARGESVSHRGFRFTVVSADSRRVKLVAVSRERPTTNPG